MSTGFQYAKPEGVGSETVCETSSPSSGVVVESLLPKDVLDPAVHKREPLKDPKAPYFYYRDFSRIPDSDPTKPVTAPGRIPNFPAKMMAILSREDLNHIISWMPHGRGWKVHKPREFEVKVIPNYFEHSKFSSFIRQANGWGFRRMISKGPDRNSYYHELFLRGCSHLLKVMKRPTPGSRPQSNPNTEPDFYMLSELSPLPTENDIPQETRTATGRSKKTKKLGAAEPRSHHDNPQESGASNSTYRRFASVADVGTTRNEPKPITCIYEGTASRGEDPFSTEEEQTSSSNGNRRGWNNFVPTAVPSQPQLVEQYRHGARSVYYGGPSKRQEPRSYRWAPEGEHSAPLNRHYRANSRVGYAFKGGYQHRSPPSKLAKGTRPASVSPVVEMYHSSPHEDEAPMVQCNHWTKTCLEPQEMPHDFEDPFAGGFRPIDFW